MDPWFIVIGLTGLIFGLICGVFIASWLVKGHYNHLLTNNRPAARPQAIRSRLKEYIPHYDEEYYG